MGKSQLLSQHESHLYCLHTLLSLHFLVFECRWASSNMLDLWYPQICWHSPIRTFIESSSVVCHISVGIPPVPVAF